MQTQTLPLTPTLLATPHRFLLHTPTNTAILSDLHLGIEHTMREQGLAFPDINPKKIRESWHHLLTTLESHAHKNQSNNETHSETQSEPRSDKRGWGGGGIIIAGDLFDSPTPDPAALALAHDLFSSLPKNIALTLLPGNHDPDPLTLRSLFPDPRITITESITLAENLLFHGHHWPVNPRTNRTLTPPTPYSTPPNPYPNHISHPQKEPQNTPIHTAIVGHQHPAVVLRTRLQSAKMICYALCQLTPQSSVLGGGSTLIILPTFSQAPLGTNLINENHWILDCPQPPADQIQIAGIIPDKDGGAVLNFGPLSQLPF